ncbi:MAG: OadG family protein [Candidatus Cryptobacteroides sp.]
MKNILKTGLTGLSLLCPLLASATEKSDAMGVKDPHGITLTVTSVLVVFAALLVLSIIYFYVGKFFSRGLRKQKKTSAPEAKTGKPDEETALAIALALRQEMSSEAEVAIAMALHRYLSEAVHDEESYVLTIRPTFGPYASRQFTLRQLPERKTVR